MKVVKNTPKEIKLVKMPMALNAQDALSFF